MEIQITKITQDDLDIIKDILQTDFDDFWNYNILKKELENETSIYVVAKNSKNEIIGFAGIQYVLEEGDITNIVVKKQERNSGVGTKLLQSLINISIKKEIKCITLEVNETNQNAIKLYEKFRFIEIGRRKKYYNGKDTAIIMKLDL